MKQVTKVVIADDHQMFIDGIKALLQGIENLEITGSANTGAQLIRILAETPADIVLMDIGMPEMDGIETTAALLSKHTQLKVIALSMYDDQNRIIKMLKAGAKGYVLKNTSKDELIRAIQTVAEGGVYYSDNIMRNAMKTITSENDPLSKLTEREIEIIRLIVKSFTNKEIADQLFISELTVNTHRKNAMRKLAIKNTAGLVKFAIDHGI